MSEAVKLVPALCTNCGGKLTIDPQKEKAVCPYCGSEFIVEKAINNYNLNIDMGSAVDSVLDFAGKQLEESREARKEMKKAELETQRSFFKTFFKYGLIFMLLFLVVGTILVRFLPDDDSGSAGENITSEEKASKGEGKKSLKSPEYELNNGTLFVSLSLPSGSFCEIDDLYTAGCRVDSQDDFDDFECSVSADKESGIGYLVIDLFKEEGDDPFEYYIFKVNIENNEIVEIIEAKGVKDISDYAF
ncbi:MAG: hypothetical protein K5931_05830 [Lachnospiraceae bacterium]|nr:hypothetical protein [Lachnospiraceae bacterium]